MMPMGTSLSRWTMLYFGAALIFLLFAECLLSAGGWSPSVDVAEPRALIIVHAVTIGWLGMLMIGALLQFAPVLTGLNLPTSHIDVLGLIGLVVGLGLLLLGFYLIDKGSNAAGPVMGAAALLLLLSILSVSMVLASLLWRGRNAHPASGLVLIGIGCLAMTAAFGALFAVTLSGSIGFPSVIQFVSSAVPYHASLGLAGWTTFAAIGVSYKLLPMFLLSHDMKKVPFLARTGSIGIAFLGAAASSLFWPEAAHLFFLAASLMFGLTIIAYLNELYLAYRGRRRKSLELNTSGSLPAFAMLAISVALLVPAIALGARAHVITAIVYLFVFGWLSGLGLAQLLKIVPFLTWIEAFGPLLGRRPTPRLGDLINSRRSALWLGVFYVAVVAAASAIVLGSDLAFRAAAILQTMSTAALLCELVLVRSLANVDTTTKRAPFQQPAFFFAANKKGHANGPAS
ncbi:hypothetical protein [Rhizobium hidalgonense]|uniref:hypothetical protein n=1 Tax=Rhizobium hidalgonense TaxID=1538159 RepID=UPI00287295AC|nr:hypothetical protein [Rhizobium hidalgonense]MDR9808461.1 hypothetical protein [Rhizobium hidalgonense]